MNLHNIVSGAIGAINPPVSAFWQSSTGYTTNANGQQVPSYSTSTVTVQEQALSADELRQVGSLNIQGVMRGFWANGDLRTADRTKTPAVGGDLITTPSGTYLIIQIFETWNGQWCHVAGQRQRGS